MKKQMLILAGSALILASCGSNNNNSANQNSQAQMDSIAKANAALQDEINKKRNDSAINAMATAKADSIEKESHKGGGEHREHREGNQAPPVTQAPPPPPPAPSPVNNRPGATGPKSVNDRPGAH